MDFQDKTLTPDEQRLYYLLLDELKNEFGREDDQPAFMGLTSEDDIEGRFSQYINHYVRIHTRCTDKTADNLLADEQALKSFLKMGVFHLTFVDAVLPRFETKQNI